MWLGASEHSNAVAPVRAARMSCCLLFVLVVLSVSIQLRDLRDLILAPRARPGVVYFSEAIVLGRFGVRVARQLKSDQLTRPSWCRHSGAPRRRSGAQANLPARRHHHSIPSTAYSPSSPSSWGLDPVLCCVSPSKATTSPACASVCAAITNACTMSVCPASRVRASKSYMWLRDTAPSSACSCSVPMQPTSTQ